MHALLLNNKFTMILNLSSNFKKSIIVKEHMQGLTGENGKSILKLCDEKYRTVYA